MQITSTYSWYVPDYDNNRELDLNSQIRVEIRPLKHKERLNLMDQNLTQEQFKNCVRSVENLTLVGDEKVVVENGRDLYELRGVPPSLITDIQYYISSISFLEQSFVAQLKFVIRFMHDDSFHNFDCDKCSESDKESRHCVDPEDVAIEINPENSAMCLYSEFDDLRDKGLAGIVWSNSEGMISTYCCPRACVTRDCSQIISIYNICKETNSLYNSGGLGDQSNLLVEAFSIISSESGKIDSERRELQKVAAGNK